jgi:CHASE2 domain-containing sensor protein
MPHELTAISLFVCVTYAFTFLVKALLDARARMLLTREGADQALLRSILAAEERQRRQSALHWGIGLIAISIGFGLIALAGWRDVTPGAVAVLAGALGLGQLAFWFVAPRTGPD